MPAGQHAHRQTVLARGSERDPRKGTQCTGRKTWDILVPTTLRGLEWIMRGLEWISSATAVEVISQGASSSPSNAGRPTPPPPREDGL